MSAFKQLKDVSIHFEQQLRSISAELFSAKIGETFEDGITKKMQDVTFLTSKLRLLKAKPLANSLQIAPQHIDIAIKDYGDIAMWKVLEQAIVKSVMQSNAVKNLITTADRNLEPGLVERKEKVIESLKEFRDQESQLRHLNSLREEREEELAAVRREWDGELGRLRDLQDEAEQLDDCVLSGPLYKKLRTVVDKLELMRWLVSRLLTSRAPRTHAPSTRALQLSRTHNTYHMFVDGTQ